MLNQYSTHTHSDDVYRYELKMKAEELKITYKSFKKRLDEAEDESEEALFRLLALAKDYANYYYEQVRVAPCQNHLQEDHTYHQAPIHLFIAQQN